MYYDDPSANDLEALYNAPAVEPMAYEPDPEPAQPEPQPEPEPLPEPVHPQASQQPSRDPLIAAQAASYENYARQQQLAEQRAANDAALENTRYQVAIQQLQTGENLGVASPSDLNRGHFAKRKGFVCGVVVGALGVGLALAAQRWWKNR